MKMHSSVENSPAPTPTGEGVTALPENSVDSKKEGDDDKQKEDDDDKQKDDDEQKNDDEQKEDDDDKQKEDDDDRQKEEDDENLRKNEVEENEDNSEHKSKEEKASEGEPRVTASNEGSLGATTSNEGSVEATPIQSDEESVSIRSSSSNENTCEPPTKKVKVSHEPLVKEEADIKQEPMEGVTEVKKELVKEEAHDPNLYLPVDGEFELVVTSVEELRELIKKFGELPVKQTAGRKKKEGGGGEEEAMEENNSEEAEEKEEGDEEEDEEEKEKSDEEDEEVSSSEAEGKRPKCEVMLCKNLCQLLLELQPWEAKLQTATKKMRGFFKSEVTEWNRKPAGYVDPSEEAWMSEPELPVEAMAPPAPKTPSPPTSSESEDEYTDDGQRKRKLRKRRAKKNMCYESLEFPGMANSVATSVSHPAEAAKNEFLDLEKTLTMSSRGRIRKTKKVVDYDQLDFEKLAAQAEKEIRIEKEKRKRMIEEDIENFQKDEKEGKVEGSNGSTDGCFVPPKLSNIKSIPNRPLLSTIYGPNIKSYLFNQCGEIKGYVDKNDKVHNGCPPRLSATENSDTCTPEPKIVLLAFSGDQALNVVLRGEKAIEVLKFLKPNTKFPNSPITLKQCGRSYICPTNIEIVTKNVPGMPDSPNDLPIQPSPVSSVSHNEPLATSSPVKTLLGAPSNSSGVIQSNNSNTGTSNPVALAYRGLPAQQKLPENNNLFTPERSRVLNGNLGNNLVNKSPASLRSDTTIVTATSIQSTTSALTSTPAKQPVKLKLVAPANGSLMTSNRGSGSMVAVPDNSGGYTLSIASDAGNQIQPNIANIIDQLQGSSDQTNANNNSVMFAGGASTPVIAAPGSGLSPQHTAPVAGQQQKTMLVTQSGQQVVLSPGQQLVKLPNGTIRILQTVPQQQQKSPIVQQVIQGGQVVQQIIGGQLVQNVVQQPQRLNAISPANKMQYVIQQPQQVTVSSAQQQPRIVMVQQQKQPNQQNVSMQYVQQGKQQVLSQQVVNSPMRQQTIVQQQGKVLQQVNAQQPQQYVQYQQQGTPVSIQQQSSNQQYVQVGQQIVQMGQQVMQNPQIVQQNQSLVQQNRQVIHSNQQVMQQQNQQMIPNSQMISSSQQSVQLNQQVAQQNQQVAQQNQQVMQQNQIIQQSSQPSQTYKSVTTSNHQQVVSQPSHQQRVVVQQQPTQQPKAATKQPQSIKVVQLHTDQGLRYAIQNENNTYTLLTQDQVSTLLPKVKTS